jgi:hypothetical protein
MIIKKKFPWRGLLHPSINWDLNLPFSYVWFVYWLIIIEWDDHQLPIRERKIVKIWRPAFLPD